MRSLRRTGIGIVAGLTMFTACPQSNAWAALEVSNTFSLRDHVGPNTVGSIPGDRLVFGAVDVTPSGPPTEVTATQGQTTIRLSFIPQALFPNQYAASLPFDPSLTGSWTLSATRGTETASAITNATPNPQLVPLVNNLRVVGAETSPLTPTLAWELPDLSGFNVTRIRIRVLDALNGNQLAQLAPLSPTATSMTIPPGTLQPARAFVFRVMLDDVSAGFLQNRSSTFSAPHVLPPLSGSGTAAVDGILSPGEWDSAGRLDFPVPRPPHDGGGTFTATLYVMNDATNLYLGMRAPLVAAPEWLMFIFDNDNNGVFADGHDIIQLTPGASLRDEFYSTQPPCPPGFFCPTLDTTAGGTSDGTGVAVISSDYVFYEIAHPLNSGDRLDFALKAGDRVGFRVNYSVTTYDPACTTGCSSNRFYPPGGTAGIGINSVTGPVAKPVANAGPDQRVSEGTAVGLDGSASSGPDLSFQWTQVAGPAVSLAGATTQTPTFAAPPLPGGFGSQTLTFQLTVSNSAGSNSDSVDVFVGNVNHAPKPHAGVEQTVKEGSLVMLDGRASFDPDGDPLTYRWLQLAGLPVALAEAETSTPYFTAPVLSGGLNGQEVLTFALTVSDGTLSQTDEVRVVVEQLDHPPVADAGMPQTVHTGRLVTLDGSRSGDPDADPIFFTWSQVGGPAVELINATTPTPSFSAPAASGPTGLMFRLIVSDTHLDSEPADVVITVVNDRPLCQLARAVPDRLWPPDHRMVPIGITGVTDPDDDTVTIRILAVTQDEPSSGLGGGDTSPDALMLDDIPLLRAERSGVGNGRVYHVSFVADDRLGGRCSGEVQVGVPKSMEAGAPIIDDGRLYDSSLP